MPFRSDKTPRIEALRRVKLFSSLSDEELSQIRKRVSIQSFKKNRIILSAEDTNEYMYIILEGKVKVIQVDRKGREIMLAVHKSGDYFGEISLIDKRTTPASIVATEDTLTAIISRKDFYEIIDSVHKVLHNLLEILCGRLREFLDKISILSFSNSSQRIKTLFVMLACEHGRRNDEGVVLNIKLTHQDIANMTGMSRETVTRIMNRWRKDREISTVNNRYIRINQAFLDKV